MKKLMLLVAASLSIMAGVAEADGAAPYKYGDKLDIAKVINLSDIPNVCKVVPAQMTYEDHQGQRHTVEYQVMGNGCYE
ncbi:DUF2790 domain-containing protein [Pseudomonas abieticivorans]|uniref:DUF2790 domain-containing protein n=1 Tax=Pseudomonas abieticivorans TaxID=2931382 RepID=UPI0020BEFB13|nr:DUF2790 domain-containing protein [Pseudomonas sp. PIA16]